MTVQELLHHRFDWEIAPGVPAGEDAARTSAGASADSRPVPELPEAA